MKETEVLKLLTYYRHDLMNQLQVVQGYAMMGKMEKTQAKLHDVISHYQEERQLMALKAPAFILWLLQFNHNSQNLRLDYHIRTEKNLQAQDQELLEKCQLVTRYFHKALDPEDIHEGMLTLRDIPGTEEIEVLLSIEGHGDFPVDLEVLQQNNIQVNVTEEAFTGKFSLF
ncbi:Spo0B domain-containing protein [Lentibacillus sediminis]|uniref:Spo0B domain-containing protein n=1 Tax=Lentibacillus sediminis TaxID=1940529 RepID=UPI0013041CD7|nr:Spo0B domain-containing protein [Lentibacillus sediminis]